MKATIDASRRLPTWNPYRQSVTNEVGYNLLRKGRILTIWSEPEP